MIQIAFDEESEVDKVLVIFRPQPKAFGRLRSPRFSPQRRQPFPKHSPAFVRMSEDEAQRADDDARPMLAQQAQLLMPEEGRSVQVGLGGGWVSPVAVAASGTSGFRSSNTLTVSLT